MAVTTLQQGLNGYAGCEDTSIHKNAADTNFGLATSLEASSQYTAYLAWPLIKFDVSSIPQNAIVSSAILYADYQLNTGYTGTISVHRVFKPWTEALATWNDWELTTKEWGSAGCNNANDSGVDNSLDGSGDDRKATAEDTYSKPAWTTGWHDWDITQLVQGWISGTKGSRGIRISATPGTTNLADNGIYRSSEYATVANRPKLVITWEPGTKPYPTSHLKKGFVSGYHCFMSAYIHAKVEGFDPLKLPDGTLF